MDAIRRNSSHVLADFDGRDGIFRHPEVLQSMRVAERALDTVQLRSESFYQYLQSEESLFLFKSAVPYVNYMSLLVGNYNRWVRKNGAPEIIVGDSLAPLAALIAADVMDLAWGSELTYRFFSMYHLIDNTLSVSEAPAEVKDLTRGFGFALWSPQVSMHMRRQLDNLDITDFGQASVPVWDPYSGKQCRTSGEFLELLEKELLIGPSGKRFPLPNSTEWKVFNFGELKDSAES